MKCLHRSITASAASVLLGALAVPVVAELPQTQLPEAREEPLSAAQPELRTVAQAEPTQEPSEEMRLPEYESPPFLSARDLLPAELLSGPRFQVQDSVPTDGFLTRFTIHSDFGVFHAASPGMARTRISEIDALAQLETFEAEDVAKDGFKRSAKELGDNFKHLIDEPEETLKGIPDGVGRFFKRTSRAVKTGVQTLQDRRAEPQEEVGAVIDGPGANLPGAPAEPAQPPPELSTTEIGARMAGRTAADLFGYSEQRRQIARKLGVDPYTSNPVLSKRLDDVAWAAFSGGLGVTVLKSLAPATTLITMTSSASNWVWDTPPGDLRVWNEGVLLGLGADQDAVDRFLRHPWYTLTLRTRLTKALDRLAGVTDRDKTMLLALSVTSFDQARFVVESLEMLSELHARGVPLDRLDVGATVVGWSGPRLIVPAPVDALSWTAELRGFAEPPELQSVDRTIYIRGGVTERVQTALGLLGWDLRSWAAAEGED